MPEIRVSLSDILHVSIRESASERGFEDTGEYIRHLIHSRHAEDRIQDRELIKDIWTYYGGYHHHKEVMAHTVFALEAAVFAAIVFLSQWPPYIAKLDRGWIAAVLVLAWALFHYTIRWQSRNRRIAAFSATCAFEALTLDSGEENTSDQKASTAAVNFDTYLWPVASALKQSDSDLEAYPAAFRRRYVANQSKLRWATFKYGFPHELMLTVGSILLVAAALVRVWAVDLNYEANATTLEMKEVHTEGGDTVWRFGK